ncbi:hypothetical protein IT575_11570 [bacterium]|nr:hypothetical protein [bacterium]
MHLHSISLYCPAKVNLGLEVLERDAASGLHRLSSIMQAIDLYDRLTVSIADPAGLSPAQAGGSAAPALRISGPFAHEISAEGNSVLAAWALLGGSQCFPPLEATLEKNIPAGSGLGGGSSDSAAMLLALRELARMLSSDARQAESASVEWPLSDENRLSQARRLELLAAVAALSDRELLPLGQRIGSDVCFFLGRPCAQVTGFGEIIEPLERRQDFALLLAVPLFGSATGEAYRALERGTEPLEAQRGAWLRGWLESVEPLAQDQRPRLRAELENSFSPLLFELDEVYGRLTDFFAGQDTLAAELSGSGSACYALYPSAAAAREAASALPKELRENLRYFGVHLPIKG